MARNVAIVSAITFLLIPAAWGVRQEDGEEASCADMLGSALEQAQWKQSINKWFNFKAKKVKVFGIDGAKAKWGDVWDQAEFSKVYEYERKRMVGIGRLRESNQDADGEQDDDTAAESKVRGICDMSYPGLKAFAYSPAVLEDLRSMMSETPCADKPLTALAQDLGDAIESLCFNDCFNNGLLPAMGKLECKRGVLTKEFYTEVIDANHQCAMMPWDTLEWITLYAGFNKCMPFYPPRLMWKVDDQAPGQISTKDGGAVCTLADGWEKTKSQSQSHIIHHGMCPEGSKCKCPMTSMKSRDTSREIRLKGSQDFFSAGGAAAGPSIAKQYVSSLVIATTIAVLTAEGLAASALAAFAVLEAPTFLVTGSVILAIKVGVSYAKFSCGTTLGCWPQHPEEVKVEGTANACRLPEKTREGGSPVWFLPPPLMKASHKRVKGFRQCVLRVCTWDEIMSARVGIGDVEAPEGNATMPAVVEEWHQSKKVDKSYKGKPNIYNCQPLTWDEMPTTMRATLIEKLKASGVEEEGYVLPSLDYAASGPKQVAVDRTGSSPEDMCFWVTDMTCATYQTCFEQPSGLPFQDGSTPDCYAEDGFGGAMQTNFVSSPCNEVCDMSEASYSDV